jgi:CBS domain-containing protein
MGPARPADAFEGRDQPLAGVVMAEGLPDRSSDEGVAGNALDPAVRLAAADDREIRRKGELCILRCGDWMSGCNLVHLWIDRVVNHDSTPTEAVARLAVSVGSSTAIDLAQGGAWLARAMNGPGPLARERIMYAIKVMTRPVATVPADATVWAAADILLGLHISAAPVVDADGRMIGIVSEADLMNRPEIGTVPGRSWLQRLLADESVLARDYMRSHSHHVTDVMTRSVVTVEEHTDLKEIASLMQRHGIKRVPVVRDGKVVGIVSRANLLQGLLARAPRPAEGAVQDENVRARVSDELAGHSWGSGVSNVVVENGVVYLWGHASSKSAREAVRVAVENVPGVKRVMNKIVVLPVEALLPS